MLPMPGFSPFWQLAWVTPDLDRSMEQFKTIYNVPSFFVMEPVFDAVFNGEQGSISIRMALANIDDHQIELIQPVGEGIVRIYTDDRASSGLYGEHIWYADEVWEAMKPAIPHFHSK